MNGNKTIRQWEQRNAAWRKNTPLQRLAFPDAATVGQYNDKATPQSYRNNTQLFKDQVMIPKPQGVNEKLFLGEVYSLTMNGEMKLALG